MISEVVASVFFVHLDVTQECVTFHPIQHLLCNRELVWSDTVWTLELPFSSYQQHYKGRRQTCVQILLSGTENHQERDLLQPGHD